MSTQGFYYTGSPYSVLSFRICIEILNNHVYIA